ncbi:MAG: hypothetical protein ACFFA3_17380 [Promethearchaeota archaeon]
MEDSKIIFKISYTGHITKFSASFGFSLSRRDIKNLKNAFLLPHSEKLEQYKAAIDRFIVTSRQFTKMLDHSESLYKRVPFRRDNGNKLLLDHKNQMIKNLLEAHQEESTELESFTELTEIEKKSIIKDRKLNLIKQQSEIQKERQEGKDSLENYNKSLRMKFINQQWRIYNHFFMENSAFKKIVSEILKERLEQYYSLRIIPSDFLKEEFMWLIRDKKTIIKRLREREIRFRKDLLEKIENWENNAENLFFPSIFTNSEFHIQVNRSSFEITFNHKLLYENILRFAYQYYGLDYEQKEIILSEDNEYFFKKDDSLLSKLPDFLKANNIDHLVTYSADKGSFKFHFDGMLRDLCKKTVHERVTLRPAPLSSISLKKKIIQKVKVGIPLSAIIAVIVIISFLFINIPSVKVEKYDSVRLEYTVWLSDEDENYNAFNPELDTVLWVKVIPITENDTTGLMLGLYNNLLGKKVQFDSGLIWLNKCIDQNRDGIDDNTGQIALSYGNSTDLYFNTCLMIQFKVLDIEKTAPSFYWDLNDKIFILIGGIILAVILGISVITLAGFVIAHRIRKRRSRPKLISRIERSRKYKIYRYVSLLATIPLLLLAALGIINIMTPFNEIVLASKYDHLVLLSIIMLLLSICVIYTIFFLVVSNIIYDWQQNKRK